MSDFFEGIAPIPFEGPESENPLAFRFYQPDRLVLGKRMEDILEDTAQLQRQALRARDDLVAAQGGLTVQDRADLCAGFRGAPAGGTDSRGRAGRRRGPCR